jgi:hypothetical protein
MQNRSMPNEHKTGNKFRQGKPPANAFTSEKVRGKANPRWIDGTEFICQICGNKFLVKPWIVRQNGSPKYCSKNCRTIGTSGENSPLYVGGKTTYRGRGWIKAREEVIARDNGTCQDCGKVIGKSIPVHHISPYRKSHLNDPDNLICLCQSCHMKHEHASQPSG